jgi:hypothetical protein
VLIPGPIWFWRLSILWSLTHLNPILINPIDNDMLALTPSIPKNFQKNLGGSIEIEV